MTKFKVILTSKLFWFLLSFGAAAITVAKYPALAGVFMIYPVYIVIMSIIYGWIINPLKERKLHKKYMNNKGIVLGTVVDTDKNPIYLANVSISRLDRTTDPEISQLYTLTNDKGEFVIPHVPNGDFMCSAYKTEYKVKSENISINDNTKVIEIILEK